MIDDHARGGGANTGAEANATAEAEVMSSAMLKAMAHPLRRRILRVLQQRRYARAADLAAELAVPANSVSFHLRTLAAAGFIEEAPDQARDRRDRVWTTVLRPLAMGTPTQPVADPIAGAAVMRLMVEDHHDLVARVMRWAEIYVAGRDDEVHGTWQQTSLHLTEAGFTALLDSIGRVVEDARAATDPHDPDVRSWQLDLVAADDTI